MGDRESKSVKLGSVFRNGELCRELGPVRSGAGNMGRRYLENFRAAF